MDSLLFPAAWEAVYRRLRAAPSMVVFDFDGTLAPLASRPSLARMTSATRRGLQRIASEFACAVVSSRPVRDLEELLGGAAVWAAVGNDALEPAPSREEFEARVSRWLPLLREDLRASSEIVLEPKGMSVALHYREASNREAAAITALALAQKLPDARVTHGRDVVNVTPIGAPGKAAALLRLLAKWPSSTVLYIGDDETDEEVFNLGIPGLIGVRIGTRAGGSSRYSLESQADVEEVMAGLVA